MLPVLAAGFEMADKAGDLFEFLRLIEYPIPVVCTLIVGVEVPGRIRMTGSAIFPYRLYYELDEKTEDVLLSPREFVETYEEMRRIRWRWAFDK